MAQKNKVLVLIVTLLLAISIAPCYGDDDAINAQAVTVFDQMLSPFCPGRSLNDCPSQQAHDLKDQIRTQLRSGEPPEKILDGLFKEYGDQYRAVPKAQGFGIFAWLLPGIFLLLGVFAIIFKLSGTKIAAGATAVPTGLSPEDQLRIQRELSTSEDD